MIEVSSLAKEYGPIRALQGVSFSVSRGEVVGFLGPNGAGKTTCMKIITGFIAATSGTATVDGKDVVTDGVDVRRRIGYLPENAPLYSDMTVSEYLAFVAGVRGVPKDAIAKRINDVAMTVGLLNVLGQEIGTLSKGYRQRAGLAQAMIHDPEILILDEPTSGLDPNQIVEIRELIRTIGKDRTVILSTHNLPEVTATCNRIIIIHRGRIVADGTPDQIRGKHGGGNTFVVELARRDGIDRAPSVLAGLAAVRQVLPIERAEAPAGAAATATFRIDAAGDADVRADVFDACVKSGWTLVELKRERLDLESIFQRLTLA
ncbi:MAG: ATP-binding cassette domain-containing protein [Deltaproteobacteria bacterium]|nr:ATP-binding cassette domain-containing protein [Deltaproteobacteria bacterium]